MSELDEAVDQLEEDASRLIEALPKKCTSFRMFVMDYGWEVIIKENKT